MYSVCLCNNTTANKTILVSNEVATCQNITVKMSRPGFKSSAWPFYQEYEKKWALTTSISPKAFFSADFKPQKQWDYDNQLRYSFLALSCSDCSFMFFDLASVFCITLDLCQRSASKWPSRQSGGRGVSYSLLGVSFTDLWSMNCRLNPTNRKVWKTDHFLKCIPIVHHFPGKGGNS